MSESGPDEDVPIVVPPPVAPEAAPYPSELEGDVTISRGDVVHLRPIRPSDGEGLVEFHRGLSDRSVYRRFFFVHPTLSTPEVEHFTHVDYTDRLALVAEDGGRIVAVGRYERSPGTTEAEVAFVVTDAYQGRGIATVLLAQLAEAARSRGITEFTAQTLAENHAMLAVFRGSGFPVTTLMEYDTVNVRFPIGPGTTTAAELL
jgi:GNAT superfamily N-acetyltransferase